MNDTANYLSYASLLGSEAETTDKFLLSNPKLLITSLDVHIPE